MGNDRPDAGQDRLRGAAPGQRALARHRRHAVRELGRQAILDGPAGVAVHPTSVRSVPAGRSTGQLHRGLDLAGRRALHGNGVRVEPQINKNILKIVVSILDDRYGKTNKFSGLFDEMRKIKINGDLLNT